MFNSTELAQAVNEIALVREASFDLDAYEQDAAANGFVAGNYYRLTISQAAANLYPDNTSLQQVASTMLIAAWNDALEWASKELQKNKNSSCTAKQTAV